MAYTSMLRLIKNKNAQYEAGQVTTEEYAAWKESTMNKLDIFLACSRITDTQYSELVGMLK